MYLRRHRRKKAGVEYESWSLVEAVRTARGPRQRIVATIGKLPGLDKQERIGWEEIGRILDGKPKPQQGLFEKQEEVPEWATVNIKAIQVERLRHFGDVYLGFWRCVANIWPQAKKRLPGPLWPVFWYWPDSVHHHQSCR